MVQRSRASVPEMSETPMNKLRELCEKWDSGSNDNTTSLREVVAELRAILPDVERLVEAAQMHAKKGHNDTCSLALCGDRYQCDCGYAIAVAALALFAQPVAPKEIAGYWKFKERR